MSEDDPFYNYEKDYDYDYGRKFKMDCTKEFDSRKCEYGGAPMRFTDRSTFRHRVNTNFINVSDYTGDNDIKEKCNACFKLGKKIINRNSKFNNFY